MVPPSWSVLSFPLTSHTLTNFPPRKYYTTQIKVHPLLFFLQLAVRDNHVNLIIIFVLVAVLIWHKDTTNMATTYKRKHLTWVCLQFLSFSLLSLWWRVWGNVGRCASVEVESATSGSADRNWKRETQWAWLGLLKLQSPSTVTHPLSPTGPVFLCMLHQFQRNSDCVHVS